MRELNDFPEKDLFHTAFKRKKIMLTLTHSTFEYLPHSRYTIVRILPTFFSPRDYR